MYLFPGIGVGALRKVYGGRNRRSKTNTEFREDAAGGVIRRILKQLEDANYLGKKHQKKCVVSLPFCQVEVINWPFVDVGAASSSPTARRSSIPLLRTSLARKHKKKESKKA